MSYLFYWTDVRPGETDILTPVKDARLVIRHLGCGEVIHTQDAPDGGWTHEALQKVQPDGMSYGADAYLDGKYIGSTET